MTLYSCVKEVLYLFSKNHSECCNFVKEDCLRSSEKLGIILVLLYVFKRNPLFPEITDEINLNPHENKKKWRGKRWNPINFFQYIHTELLFVLMLLI